MTSDWKVYVAHVTCFAQGAAAGTASTWRGWHLAPTRSGRTGAGPLHLGVETQHRVPWKTFGKPLDDLGTVDLQLPMLPAGEEGGTYSKIDKVDAY